MRAWVTGGSGFVGSNVVAVLRAAGDDVHCAAHRTEPRGATSVSFVDLCDTDAVTADMERAAPDVVVHCAIRNDLMTLNEDRRGAWADFVDATRGVVDAANRVGAFVVLVSSDWVFDGTRPLSAEDEPPRPVNSYGVLKLLQERLVLERARAGAVARVSAVSGAHHGADAPPRSQDVGFGYLALSIVTALRRGEPFTVWESPAINGVATPSLASSSAQMIRRIGELGVPGIYHCCGADAVTRRELAELCCEVLELDRGLLRFGGPPAGAIGTEPVPYDTSLDASATARRLGIAPLGIRELLRRLGEELAARGLE